MKETLKYIDILNWGYSGFAPMTLNVDYNKSIEQVEERLALLDALDYDALFVEAIEPNSKATLLKYQSTGNSFEYGLHFMRDRQILLSSIPTMYKAFKEGADRFRADGLWTDEQWKNYMVTLSTLEKAFEDRLTEFATAYDYTEDDTPEPQQEQTGTEQTASTIPTIKDTDKERFVFRNALQKQYMTLQSGCYKWCLNKTLLAYMCGRLYCGDRIKEDVIDYSKVYIKGKTQMPAQEVKALFGGVDVAANRYSIKAPPRNSWKVDELFERNGASK